MRKRGRYPAVASGLKMRVWNAMRETARARGVSVATMVRRAAALFLEARRDDAAARAWLAMQRAFFLGHSSSPTPPPADQSQPTSPSPRPSFSR